MCAALVFLSSTSLLLFPNLVSWTLLGVAIMLLAAQNQQGIGAVCRAASAFVSAHHCAGRHASCGSDLCDAVCIGLLFCAKRWALFDGLADALLALTSSVRRFFLAVKMSGIPYVALLDCRQVRWRAAAAESGATLSFAGCAAAQCGCDLLCIVVLHYRNWLRFGNPIGYLPVSLLG